MLNSDINESSVSWLPPSIPRYSEDTENEDHSLINLTKDVIDIVLGHCGITISDTTSSLFSFHMEDTNEADRGPRFFPSPFISPIRITRTFLEDRRASRSMLQKPACTKTIDNKFAWQIYHIIFKKWIMRNSLGKWFPDIKTGWRAMSLENNQSKHGEATCDKLVTQSFMWHIAGQHVCFFYGNHFSNDCVTKFATCRFPMFFHYDWFCGNLVFALSNNSCDIAGQPVIYMEIISLKTAWQSLSQVASRLYVTDFASIVWGLVHSATFGFMEALFLCSTRVRALPGIWSQFELSMFTNFNFC